MGKINSGAKPTKGSIKNNSIRKRIVNHRQSFDEQKMMLANGDLSQYEILKKGSVNDYLIKLNNYVEGVESQIEANKQKTNGKRPR